MLQIPLWKRVLIWGVCVLGILFASPNAFYTRVEGHNDAVAEIEARGGSETPELAAKRDAWPSWMPSGLVNLGLDLRGGAHLLVEVKLEEVYESRMLGFWPEVRNALRDERATIGTIRPQDSSPEQLRIRISEPAGMAHAIEVVRGLARPVVSLTGVGSVDYDVTGEGDEIVIQLSEAERQATDDRTMQQSIEVIRRRVDEAGTREPTIQRQGTNRIIVDVPGIGSAAELKELIGKTAKLTFHPVIGGARANNNPRSGEERALILPELDNPEIFYPLEPSPVVSGEDLIDSQPGFDQNGRPAVTFRFNPSGAQRFGVYTAENVGTLFAIVLDNEIVSAPRINEPIPGGSGQITGNFTVEEADRLSILLRAGALPASLEFVEERTIGPELGQDSIDAGKIAALIAMVAVIVFMVLSYGLFGVFANIALAINVALIFAVLSILGATLTLPGIAGIVLTIGMAVDANVLVFERIREELKSARGPARAIELGYERAMSAIIDANITTFLTALILFIAGAGPVRGFAITLGIGILTSVFTAFFVTRLIIVIWYARKRPKTITV